MIWLDALILVTYLAQVVQVTVFPVPSAGSTLEMFFKGKKGGATAANHPAVGIRKSPLKTAFVIAATFLSLSALLLPLVHVLVPQAAPYFLPWFSWRSTILAAAAALLLLVGNVLTYMGVMTLRRRVSFHPIGETTRLYTGGIFGYIRNPVSTGLLTIWLGFLLAIPAWVTLAGLLVFLANTLYRLKMEEAYLSETFGEDYRRYLSRTGKFLPRLKKRPARVKP